MKLRPVCQQGRRNRNTETAAEIARQIDERRSVVTLPWGYRRIGCGIDRHKEKRQSNRLIDARHRSRGEIDVQVESRQMEKSESHGDKTNQNEPSRFNFGE